MRWYAVFIKGVREQIRDYWILIMIVVMAPLFIAIYYLMVETETPHYQVTLVNEDRGMEMNGTRINLGDSLLFYGSLVSGSPEIPLLQYGTETDRESAIERLRKKDADVVVVIPADLTRCIFLGDSTNGAVAQIELVGDVTSAAYMIGAIWTEELINRFVLAKAGINLPVEWRETTLGHSGERSMFELYVPGLLILSIIMIIFSASAAIVREPETRTLERLKISRLTALEFLGGISLVQIILAILSLTLALLTAMALGYTLIPGTLGFIMLISILTAISMISFSLIVAAMCRSVKEVAIIGTFPLFLLMFFTGAAFPISGGKLFSLGNHEVMMNDILSPKFAVEALNKVLIRGLEIRDAVPDIVAMVILTLLYLIVGTWAFKMRHMKAR